MDLDTEKTSIPNLLKIFQSKDFQSFAHEVHTGNDENLKLKLQNYLLKLANLYENSRTNKKRPFENETNGSLRKKVKIDTNKAPNLPQEIWLKIMNYLKTNDLFLNFGMVCKFLNGLTLDSRAVKYLDVNDIDDKTKYNQVSKVIKRSKFLIKIKIESSKSYWKQLICQALKSARLKTLKILNQNAKRQSFGLENAKKLVKLGKCIEELEISDDNINLESEVLHEISKIKTLKSVKIPCFTDQSLVNFANNCKELEKLEKLTLKVSHLTRNDCESISQLRGLKELLILQNDTGRGRSNLAIIFKSIDTVNLKRLILEDKGDWNGVLFDTISNRHFPALQRVYMQSSGYSDQAVKKLVYNCPSLKSAQLYISAYHRRRDVSYSRSISIDTLINSCIRNNIYIDFGTMADEFASLIRTLKENDLRSWSKYQDLKRTFEEWCNENMWTYIIYRLQLN